MSQAPYRAILRSVRCSTSWKLLPSPLDQPAAAVMMATAAPARLPKSLLHTTAPKHPETGADGSDTHFGFETVSNGEKTAKVHQVFEQVAENYDKMNDAMSFGIHRVWKDAFVRNLSPYPGTKILDVAGGTGDIALRLVKAMDRLAGRRSFSAEAKCSSATPTDLSRASVAEGPLSSSGAKSRQLRDVTVLDLSESMLEVGKKRAMEAGIDSRVDWVHGNAEELPFADDTFDAYTVAFGIRNVTHIERALDEAYRVLKPGGRFMCLEFSQVHNPLFAWFYEKYSFQVIPVLGQLIASDWKSYQYLVESIRMFPDQEEFLGMIDDSGFSAVTYKNLSQGICAIHSGFKLR